MGTLLWFHVQQILPVECDASFSHLISGMTYYDIAESAYKVGRSTLIELNDAQLGLTQAQLAQSQAIYNFVTAKAQLEQVLGQDFISE